MHIEIQVTVKFFFDEMEWGLLLQRPQHSRTDQ